MDKDIGNQSPNALRRSPAKIEAIRQAMRQTIRCQHTDTYPSGWPDGGAIEICRTCGRSRYLWEQGHSAWLYIKDIPATRRRVQASIDRIMAQQVIETELAPTPYLLGARCIRFMSQLHQKLNGAFSVS